jgi:hypothetical protein
MALVKGVESGAADVAVREFEEVAR